MGLDGWGWADGGGSAHPRWGMGFSGVPPVQPVKQMPVRYHDNLCVTACVTFVAVRYPCVTIDMFNVCALP